MEHARRPGRAACADTGWLISWGRLTACEAEHGSLCAISEDPVHHLGPRSHHRPKLMAVDRLGHLCGAVTYKAADLLDGHPVAGQQRHERVAQLPRSPV